MKKKTILSIDHVPFYDQNTLENWKEKGLLNKEDALFWSRKACGIACVKMIAEAFGKDKVPFGSLIHEAFSAGAYKEGVGWIHAKIAEFTLKKFNLESIAERNVSIDFMRKIIESGGLIIASIGFGFYRGKSGHLIVVLGCEIKNGVVNGFYVHHPSSKKELCMNRGFVHIKKFINSFSGNIIKINKNI